MQWGLLRRGWSHDTPVLMVVLAIGCGLAGASGAIVLRLLIRVFQAVLFAGSDGLARVMQHGLLAETEDLLDFALSAPHIAIVLVPVLGGVLVGPIVYRFASEARGHGVPEVMEAVATRGGAIRPRVALAKVVASAITIGSGGSVGREGPIVQIGSALGSVLGQFLGLPSRQIRTLVGCGAAAGIAATFNAPIAGALFAVEIILGDFAVSQFSPIVISSVVATVISRYFLGNHPAFPVPEYELVSPLELGPYMLVGALAGLFALVFVWLLYGLEEAFERLAVPGWTKPAIGGLLLGLLALFLPEILGVGYGTMTSALHSELPLLFLAVLLFGKLFATSITLASGGSGGIFAPSLFMGAMVGGLVGGGIHQLLPASTASYGAYALVTMGAFVAAATHAPITAILIIFELTQTIEIMPPLMAACVVSTLVATFLRRDSIYTLKLRRRGIEMARLRDPNVLKSLYVRDIIDREPATLPRSAGLDEILKLVVEGDHTELFITDEQGQLLGAVYFSELRRVILEQEELRSIVVAGDLLETDRPTVTSDDDLDLVMQIFSHERVEEIGVVESAASRKLVGSVHKRDVIHCYNQEVMRRDLAGGVATTVGVVDRVHRVDLGAGYVVQEIEVPRRFVGRSLAELDLRTRAGVQVLMIRGPATRGGRGAIRVPGPSDRLQEGDRLVVAGPKAAMEAVEAGGLGLS